MRILKSLNRTLYLLLAISIFALGFPAAEYLLDDWDVVTVITVRNVFAFVLLFFIWIVLEGSSTVRNANWIKGFWIGGIGFGMGSFLLLYCTIINNTCNCCACCSYDAIGSSDFRGHP